jgi:hypothetical protein
VGGDLSDDQKKFHAALAGLNLQTPLGVVTLNENRQATGTVFVNEVMENPDGTLSNKMVAKQEGVNQTLGMTAEEFRAMGLPSRDTPDCAKLRG